MRGVEGLRGHRSGREVSVAMKRPHQGPDPGRPGPQLSHHCPGGAMDSAFPGRDPQGHRVKGTWGLSTLSLMVAPECLKIRRLVFKNGPKIQTDISPKKIRNQPMSP